MSGEKKIEAPEPIVPGPISDSPLELSGNDMVKDGTPSDSISSESAVGNAMPRNKLTGQPSTLEQGYHGTFVQSNDKGYFNSAGGSFTGIQSDNNSLLCYLPGYGPPYTTGFMGIDVKPTYASPEYLQQARSYGSETFRSYSYDPTYSGNGSTRTAAVKSVAGPSSSGKPNGYNIARTSSNFSIKTAALPFNSKVQPSCNFSRSIHQNQTLNPSNKLGSGLQSTGLMKGLHPASKFSSLTNRNPVVSMQYGPVNINSRVWNNSYRYNKSGENFVRNAETEALTELARGPRSENRNNSPIEMDKCNIQDFQIEYDNAKLYVIKSYSEDDVHKCIKYSVWSSTPNGNRKLDAAFREAETKSGGKCPIFLFFSVNGSGQFVGVAEMIGPVDFSKNMDFWQLDKWNGFFPVKWHIIKDVPNTALRHIILDNNENRPVTYSRDTQEIGLKQGLEMLRIFKNYSERTSILDDFNFYENRHKSLKPKRRNASKTSGETEYNNCKKHFEGGGEGTMREKSAKADPSSVISLTKNLSLN